VHSMFPGRTRSSGRTQLLSCPTWRAVELPTDGVFLVTNWAAHRPCEGWLAGWSSDRRAAVSRVLSMICAEG
jgi:hypothetical protein